MKEERRVDLPDEASYGLVFPSNEIGIRYGIYSTSGEPLFNIFQGDVPSMGSSGDELRFLNACFHSYRMGHAQGHQVGEWNLRKMFAHMMGLEMRS